MARHGVISLGARELLAPLKLKKYLLLFDQLIIDTNSLIIAKSVIEVLNKVKPLNLSNLPFNLQNIEYLQSTNMLQVRKVAASDVTPDDFYALCAHSAGYVDQTIGQLESISSKVDQIAAYSNVVDSIPYLLDTLPLHLARVHSLVNNLGPIETYPILPAHFSESHFGKKETVLNFVLKKMPEPDENEPWERILDFKRDPDSQRKFYGLIKWINDVSKKELHRGELEDEFQYLYHEYVHQFKLHKLKCSQSALEIIITAGIDFFAGQTGSIVQSSLFNLSRRHLQLLEEEAKLPGREVAYIVKASCELNSCAV